MKKLNNRGFTHDFIIIFFVLIFAIAGVAYMVASRAETPGFTYLGTHPQASLQSTALGKTILSLKGWNGKIYSGYGDFGANTGPLSITPFDPATKTFASAELSPDQSEAIGIFRLLNGKLYAPSTDPRGATTTDYAYAQASGGTASWEQVGPSLSNTNKGVGMEHAFDMASLNGDLWLVGSKGTNSAVAYRSTDGGVTWTKSLDVPASSGNYNRFYGIGTYNGKVYVQAHIMSCSGGTSCYSGGSEANSHVFDGTSWSLGPTLNADSFWHPETFAGKMIYLTWAQPNGPTATGMLAFDGTRAVSAGAPAAPYDFTIDGNTLYVLGGNGIVYSTTDLVTWYQQAAAPTTARSITVYNGQIYVGTTDSKIYGAPVNTSPTQVSGGGTTTTTGKTKGTGSNNGKKPH
jgi:hypothetical protein